VGSRRGADRADFVAARVAPDGPGNARELVGYGDRGFVVPALRFDVKRPGGERVGVLFVLGRPENGSRTVDEEHAEVGISAFGDLAESAGVTARAFFGHEPEITREPPPGGEAADVADESDERGGRERSDAGDRQQVFDSRDLAPEQIELSLGIQKTPLAVADLLAQLDQEWA